MIQALNFSGRQRIMVGFTNTVYGLSGNVFNFAFSLLLVRLFSLPLWGSFAQLMLVLMIANQLTGWGNKEFLLREYSRQSRLSFLWQTSLISRVPIVLLLIPVLILFLPSTVNPWLFAGWMASSFLLRSFDSSIVFEKRFKEAILIESAGFVGSAITIVIFRDMVTLAFLITLFAVVALSKALFYAYVFRKPFLQSYTGRFDRNYLAQSLPYFLPAFIGLLQSKADTFVISIKLSSQALGEYYVLLSLLSYCHAIPVLVITPFLKNLYRINPESYLRIRKNFLLAGLSWSIVCIVVIYCILEVLYHIHFSFPVYGLACLALPPYFVYYLLTQQFLREDRPYTIVIISGSAAFLNFILSFILVDYFGFVGGLISFTLLQWLILAGYLALSNGNARR